MDSLGPCVKGLEADKSPWTLVLCESVPACVMPDEPVLEIARRSDIEHTRILGFEDVGEVGHDKKGHPKMASLVGIPGFEPVPIAIGTPAHINGDAIYGVGMRNRTDLNEKTHLEETGQSVVGIPGFEPGTPCSQSRCATGLRYIPKIFSRLNLGPSRNT